MTKSRITLDRHLKEFADEAYEESKITRIPFINEITTFLSKYDHIFAQHQDHYKKFREMAGAHGYGFKAGSNDKKYYGTNSEGEYFLQIPSPYTDKAKENRKTNKDAADFSIISISPTRYALQVQYGKGKHWELDGHNEMTFETAYRVLIIKSAIVCDQENNPEQIFPITKMLYPNIYFNNDHSRVITLQHHFLYNPLHFAARPDSNWNDPETVIADSTKVAESVDQMLKAFHHYQSLL